MNRKIQAFLFLMLIAFLVAGCSSKSSPQDEPADKTPAVGIIDMQQAVKAHPQYKAHEALQTEINTLKQQLASYHPAAAQTPSPSAAGGDMAGVQASLGQEFNQKMTAKHAAINQRLEEQAAQFRQNLEQELKSYTAEIDQTYQPQIFNLQLKLKTVQLSQAEMEPLQQEMEKLQAERNEKINAKHKELEARMEQLMAPEKKKAESELQAYSQELNAEMASRAAAKQAEFSQRLATLNPAAPATGDGPSSNLEQQLTAKEQELSALENSIMADIRDKTGKVAVAKGLDSVLTNIKLNISAVDITADVIAEFKK
ncbi:hypothetical protein P22_0609 [Propionispora sp. 2/2-37]|uniref:hypothetical protein n=1 Tax=Propionispora sp. 2/2-37 TaxID=1677858 RepID=UPI0006BB9893|nr:hypothetical protein [Propionispora sp. 2/2-37]CUH94543.1 hypothetical protein P22_0609 [Propionispora sp. 2/2-37]